MLIEYDDGFYDLKPSKIACVGRNYAAHAIEMESAVPEQPVIFLKPPSSLIPTNSEIVIPEGVGTIHHEIELAVIIGKTGKNIPLDEAMDYVLGYTVFLDITARDLQRIAKKNGLPWTISKGYDTFAPMGPRIVRRDAIDPHSLEMRLWVNGVLRQKGSTSNMLFRIPELISYISSVMTLEEDDIIATGTPEGVGPLREGDVVDAEIEGIGVLHETVVKR